MGEARRRKQTGNYQTKTRKFRPFPAMEPPPDNCQCGVLGWWWLSFTYGDRLLGSAIARGVDGASAARECWKLGINPGGAVDSIRIDVGDHPEYLDMAGRRLSVDETLAVWRAEYIDCAVAGMLAADKLRDDALVVLTTASSADATLTRPCSCGCGAMVSTPTPIAETDAVAYPSIDAWVQDMAGANEAPAPLGIAYVIESLRSKHR